MISLQSAVLLFALFLTTHNVFVMGVPAYSECYDPAHPHTYTGHASVTESGTPCQMWASQSPHQHTLGADAEAFTDGTLPANYCRSTLDGDGGERPWCYTTSEHIRWEYCDVPQCSCTGDFLVYGSSCYVYVNKTTSWRDAQTHCSSLGAFLAEVKAFDQSAFLQELTLGVEGRVPTWGAWLGGTYLEGQWAWAVTGEAMTYTNWAQGEPTNIVEKENCLETNRHNKWRAFDCDEEIGSICQKTPNELPNDERHNILANVVDQQQATMENLTNILKNLIKKENELDDLMQDARHIESGTFQCGTLTHWTSNPVQIYEATFANAYLTPPTVHLSLATLDTNVNQRHLDVSFTLNGTSTTGFKVVCENQQGRHYSKLWKLDLTWLSIPGEPEPTTLAPTTLAPTTLAPTTLAPKTPCAHTATSLARQPATVDGIPVLCDTVTDGGNWIIFQRRTVGDVNFYRNWTEYDAGFGTVTGDHWLGLTHIHNLCNVNMRCVVRFDLGYDGTMYYEEYSSFYLGDAEDKFRLHVSGPSGTAGDTLTFSYDNSNNNNLQQFSTPDQDHDAFLSGDCAKLFHSSWWFKQCGLSNLNGRWGVEWGMQWYTLTNMFPVTSSEIKVRHHLP